MNKPQHCTDDKRNTTFLLQSFSGSRQVGYVVLCHQRDFCSGEAGAGFPRSVSQEHQDWAKPHFSPSKHPWQVLALYYALLNLQRSSDYFSPLSRKFTCLDQTHILEKKSSDSSHFWVFLPKTCILHILFFPDKAGDSRPSWCTTLCKSDRFIFTCSWVNYQGLNYFFIQVSSSHQLWTS